MRKKGNKGLTIIVCTIQSTQGRSVTLHHYVEVAPTRILRPRPRSHFPEACRAAADLGKNLTCLGVAMKKRRRAWAL